jgi:putative tryptophan/tyrosine transport system substrate-binding protein
MKRREFVRLVGGAGAASAFWAFTARGQRPMAVIGFLGSRAPDDDPDLLAAFRLGLKEAGYIEGQNVAIEYHFAENQYDRLPVLAADLVQRQVAVICANGPAAKAAKAATETIPIVFTAGFDPIESGLVASLNRPGGNVTGLSFLDVELGPKRLDLLHELIPKATNVTALVNPTDRARATAISENMQAAARKMGLQLHVLYASTDSEIDAVFANLAQQQTGALVVGGDPFFNSRAEHLGGLTVRHAVPAIYQLRAFAAGGGLVSYADLGDSYRQMGISAGRILNGEKPADMPVQQATKVELIINLKTAKGFGVTVPLPLLGRANEVIE